MTRVHPLYIVVEDVLSETVMSRLLAHVEYTGNMVCRIARGNGQIKSNLAKYKQASRVIPHIILTDLDRFHAHQLCSTTGTLEHSRQRCY